MSEQKEKINKILSAIKIEVENIDKLEKDVNSILSMFDELKEIQADKYDSSLERKKISIDDLRDDEAYDWEFRTEMRGKYFRVPSVSKKK